MMIDRLEEDFAVIEILTDAGELLYKNLPLSWLPEEAAEGDVLRKTDGQYIIDRKKTEKRRQKIAQRLASLRPENTDAV
jgi:hypothetical protein